MEIWIIRDGEKIGPLHDFEIRRKISAGELPATTPAWHEGRTEWKPLSELDLFKREFQRTTPPENPFPPPATRSSSPMPAENPQPQSPPQTFARRFWARWLDLTLYSAFWWLGMWAVGQNMEAALSNPWIIFFKYIPWFAIEPILIHYYATTPGKWLLGLTVLNNDGSRLDLGASTRRAMRVLFTGIGFGFSYLAFFFQLLSLVMATRIGSTLWDHAGGHQVLAAPLRGTRIVAAVAAYFLAIVLHSIVLFPYFLKESIRRNPEFKEYLEKNYPAGIPTGTPATPPPASPPAASTAAPPAP